MTASERAPEPYTIRVSRRARRVRLVLSPAEGLVVVIPPGFDRRRVPAVVAAHRDWILRARARLLQQARLAGGEEPLGGPGWAEPGPEGAAGAAAPGTGRAHGRRPAGSGGTAAGGTSGRAGGADGRRQAPAPGPGVAPAAPSGLTGALPPPRLHLRAVGETWAVRCVPGPGAGLRLRVHPATSPGSDAGAGPECTGILELSGQVEDPALWQEALRRWLAGRARLHLVPWLERLAARHGFTVTGVSIRCQKTRWGSCSARRRIQLNLKLLFLPPELAEHVLLHELCHTVHLDHSPAFWALLRSCDPAADDHRRRLRGGWSFVPLWLRG